MLSQTFPTYTDNKFCDECSQAGSDQQGDNYCCSCQFYLCFDCTLEHGRNCLPPSKYTGRKAEVASQLSRESLNRKRIQTENGENVDLTESREQCRQDLGSASSCKVSYSEKRGDFRHSLKRVEYMKLHSRQTNYERLLEYPYNSTAKRNIKQFEYKPQSGTFERVNDKGARQTKRELESKVVESIIDKDGHCSNASSCFRPSLSSRQGTIVVGESRNEDKAITKIICRQHLNHNIENYCRKHDTLCCEECLTVDHMTCGIEPIDEVASGIRDNVNLDTILEDAEALKLATDVAILKYTTWLHELERELAEAKRDHKMNSRYPSDVLRPRRIRDILNEKKEVDKDMSELKIISTDLELTLNEIKTARHHGNDVLTFVALKRNQNTIVKSKHELFRILGQYPNFKAVETTTKPTESRIPLNIPVAKLNTKGFDKNKDRDGTVLFNNEVKSNHVVALNNPNETKSDINGDIVEGKNLPNNDTTQRLDEKGAPNGQDMLGNKTSNIKETRLLSSSSRSRKRSTSHRRSPKRARSPHKKDKIITYGLATDFFLNDKTDTDGNEILRLQTPEPDREVASSIATPIEDDVESEEDDNEIKPEDEAIKSDKSVKDIDELSAEKEKKLNEIGQLNSNTMRVNDKTSAEGKDKLKHCKHASTIGSRNSKIFSSPKLSRNHTMRLKSSNSRKHQSDKSCNRKVEDWMQKSEKSQYRKPRRENVNSIIPSRELTFTRESSFIKVPDPNRSNPSRSRSTDEDVHLHSRYLYSQQAKTKLMIKAEQIMRLPSDKAMCEIAGLTCLSDGRIALSDTGNRSVKVIPTDSAKITTLFLDEPPADLTAINDTLLMAIYGLACDQLIVISAKRNIDTMILENRFRTGCVCKALATYNCHVYLLCVYNFNTEIRVLDTDGLVSIRISLKHIVPNPVGIVVNPMNGVIVVLDKLLGAYTVETGREVKRYSDKHVNRYRGIAADDNNNIFVCTEAPGGIYEVDWRTINLVPVSLGYALEDVKMACYNTTYKTLVVACRQAETLQIYNIGNNLALENK